MSDTQSGYGRGNLRSPGAPPGSQGFRRLPRGLLPLAAARSFREGGALRARQVSGALRTPSAIPASSGPGLEALIVEGGGRRRAGNSVRLERRTQSAQAAALRLPAPLRHPPPLPRTPAPPAPPAPPSCPLPRSLRRPVTEGAGLPLGPLYLLFTCLVSDSSVCFASFRKLKLKMVCVSSLFLRCFSR